jgi:hypothetical protein
MADTPMSTDEDWRSMLAQIFERIDRLGDAVERIEDGIRSLRAEMQESCHAQSCRAQECRADGHGSWSRFR